MAQRGIVLLKNDALEHGNSGNPGDLENSDFASTLGRRTSLEILKSLPSVNAQANLTSYRFGAWVYTHSFYWHILTNGVLST
jgi:hypothetical protein